MVIWRGGSVVETRLDLLGRAVVTGPRVLARWQGSRSDRA